MDKIRLIKPDVGDREIELIKELFTSGQLVEGEMTRRFENMISELSGTKYTMACTSATTGLELCLKACGVGEGHEVIVPSFTHPATALAVMNVGAIPVITDVELDSLLMSRRNIEEALTEKTKAVIPVSWGGYPLDLEPIMELAKAKNFIVIEDAACSLGTKSQTGKTGEMADLTVYSFHPRKLIALGDGGAITTNNEDYYKFISSYKHFGIAEYEGKKRFVNEGSNYRLSNILSAVGVGQLERINQIIETRNNLAKNYYSLLKDVEGIAFPTLHKDSLTNYQSFCIRFKKEGIRDHILKEMRAKNIEVQIGTFAIHREPVFEPFRKVGDLVNSSSLADNLLTLPMHKEVTPEDQKRVAEELKKLL
jgi:perosamine synthetase